MIHQVLIYTLYSDIRISLGNMPNNLISLSNDDSDQASKNTDTLDEVENPLNLHRFNFQETLFIPNVLSSEDIKC